MSYVIFNVLEVLILFIRYTFVLMLLFYKYVELLFCGKFYYLHYTYPLLLTTNSMFNYDLRISYAHTYTHTHIDILL